MGCGSSSLKGEKGPEAVGSAPTSEPAPQPMKKVRTNFSDVDYNTASQKRRNTEYAPTETERRPTTVPEEQLAANRANKQSLEVNPMGEIRGQEHLSNTQAPNLQPYKSYEGTGNEMSQNLDPTSAGAKEFFAASNSPCANQKSFNAQAIDSNATTLTSADGAPRKRSLVDRYRDLKMGRTTPYSDEELKQYTGKTNAELNEWAQTAPGVGRNQSAGKAALPGGQFTADHSWADRGSSQGISGGV